MVISETYLYKGSVATTADLPADANAGDIYYVADIRSDAVFVEEWITLGSLRSDTAVAKDKTDFIEYRQMFRTTCKCCGGLMPRTTGKLDRCIYCGAVQDTFEKACNLK